MLNEEVQAWVDMGFSEEEAIAMADTVRARYDDFEITDDDSDDSLTESFRRRNTTT